MSYYEDDSSSTESEDFEVYTGPEEINVDIYGETKLTVTEIQLMGLTGHGKVFKERKDVPYKEKLKEIAPGVTFEYDVRFVEPKRNRGESEEIFDLRKELYCFIFDIEEYKNRAATMSKAIVSKLESGAEYNIQMETIITQIILRNNFPQHLREQLSPILVK